MDCLDDLVDEHVGELDGILGTGAGEALDEGQVGERIAVPEFVCGIDYIDDALHKYEGGVDQRKCLIYR